MSERPEILEGTAAIVAAYVGRNAVSTEELPGIMTAVYGALAHLGEPAEEQKAPAVPIRQSVKPHAVTCLECGAQMKVLKRHLRVKHSATPGDYRRRWNLPRDYPMVAPEYSVKRSAFAVDNGLGHRREAAE